MPNLKSFLTTSDSNVGKKKPIIIKNKTEKINILWGFKISPQIDIIFLFFITKFIQLSNINCHIYILIADIHTLIDKSFKLDVNNKLYLQNHIEKISNFLKKYISADTFTIIKGSDFQLTKEYILDTYNILTNYNIGEMCQELNINPLKNNFKTILHPLLQSLDEHYIQKTYNIDIDMQIGMEYQYRYYTFSKKNNAMLNYKKRLYSLFYIPVELIEKPLALFQQELYYKQKIKYYNIKSLYFILTIFKQIDKINGKKNIEFFEIDESYSEAAQYTIIIDKIIDYMNYL